MDLPQWIHDPGSWLAEVFAFSHLLHIPQYLKGRKQMDLTAVIKDVELVVAEVQPVIAAVQEFASADTDEAKAAKLVPILTAFIDKLPMDSAVKAVAETPAILELVAKLAVAGVDAVEHLTAQKPAEVAPEAAPEAPAVPQ